MVGLLFGAAVVVGLLAMPRVIQAQEPLRFPPPSGPHAVGRAVYHWVDAARDEVHTPDPGDVREILAEVWYPAQPSPDAEPAAYLTPELAALYSEIYQLPVEDVAAIRSNAVADAPLSGQAARYPVVIFSPGFSAAPRQYTALLEGLASHGFVVFALSHPYATTLTVFPDGRVIEPMRYEPLATLWAPDDLYRAENENVWQPDVRFALAQIAALDTSDPQSRFEGRLDLDAVGMFGHSAGAQAVTEVCLDEPRCAAVISLDGARSARFDVAFDRPFMFMVADNGVAGMVAPYENAVERLVDDFFVLMIPRTNHNSFNDAAFWAPLVFEQRPDGLVAAQVALLDYRMYVRAFFNHYLRGETETLLDGPPADHPEVFFLRRSEPVTPPTSDAPVRQAAIGSQTGEIPVGEAEVWAYEGAESEMLSLYLLADRPADKTTQEQREQYDLLDTVLVVRGPDGSVLAANDDAGLSTNSAIEGLTLPVDGTYTLEARSWENQTGGGYTLLIERGEP